MQNFDYVNAKTNDGKFKTLLSRIHGNLLKDYGFKKDNQNFRRITVENGINKGCIINFQKSAFNGKTETKFTVNVGRMISSEKIDERFKEYECRIGIDRARLAVLGSQERYDKWWIITPGADMTSIEEEIINLIKNTAFAWFGINN